MLFMITQTHTPDTCPKDEKGRSRLLFDVEAEGIEVHGVYGAYAEHIVYYLVEADNTEAVEDFLLPGFTRCTAKITPVSETPISDDRG